MIYSILCLDNNTLNLFVHLKPLWRCPSDTDVWILIWDTLQISFFVTIILMYHVMWSSVYLMRRLNELWPPLGSDGLPERYNLVLCVVPSCVLGSNSVLWPSRFIHNCLHYAYCEIMFVFIPSLFTSCGKN